MTDNYKTNYSHYVCEKLLIHAYTIIVYFLFNTIFHYHLTIVLTHTVYIDKSSIVNLGYSIITIPDTYSLSPHWLAEGIIGHAAERADRTDMHTQQEQDSGAKLRWSLKG